jgi:Cu(I)/Ag(I) efflux system membrane fusion protein
MRERGGPAGAPAGRPARGTPPLRRRNIVVVGIVVAASVAVSVTWWAAHRRPAGSATHAAARARLEMSGGDMGGMSMSQDGTVQLTASQLRQFGVTFGAVEERILENTVRTVGTVVVDEATLAQVTPRFDGYVDRLYVAQTGQPVRKGQPLMDVYSPELLAAEQELLVAEKLQQSIGASSVPGIPAASTDLVAAAKRRLALWDISDAQIDDILRTGTVRRVLTLYAPASGVILEKHVVEGQAIRAGEMLYTIANLSTVWVEVALREQDAGAVRIGSRAAVELAAYPGRPLAGRVAYVYPTVDQAAHTVRARVEVPNPTGRLKPGMYATVTLTTPARRALTVPTSAVLNTGDRTLVFMDMGGGRLMPTEVVAGRTAGAYTEVLSGVEPGQRVVTSAQYLLDSESNLAEVMKSMIGQMNMSGSPRAMKNMGDTPSMPGMRLNARPMHPSPTLPRR